MPGLLPSERLPGLSVPSPSVLILSFTVTEDLNFSRTAHMRFWLLLVLSPWRQSCCRDSGASSPFPGAQPVSSASAGSRLWQEWALSHRTPLPPGKDFPAVFGDTASPWVDTGWGRVWPCSQLPAVGGVLVLPQLAFLLGKDGKHKEVGGGLELGLGVGGGTQEYSSQGSGRGLAPDTYHASLGQMR